MALGPHDDRERGTSPATGATEASWLANGSATLLERHIVLAGQLAGHLSRWGASSVVSIEIISRSGLAGVFSRQAFA